MTTFIKTADGLKESVNTKVKTFANEQAVLDAIAQGVLKEGDSFATPMSGQIEGDLATRVEEIEAVIPGDASPTNLLATERQIPTFSLVGDVLTITF